MTKDSPRIGVVADKSRKAKSFRTLCVKEYRMIDMDVHPRTSVDMILVVGGDGFMLHTLHRFMDLEIPFYGMNCGTVGFLLNRFGKENLIERICSAKITRIYPLEMETRLQNGDVQRALAMNEISLFRQTNQAAHLEVIVDGTTHMEEMVADGILVATPAGSSAYNLSAGGPIIPIGGNILAMTPLNVFRPRRWRGAILPHKAKIHMKVLHPKKRPVSATADFHEIRDIAEVIIREKRSQKIQLLFDHDHALEDRIFKEQFLG